MSDRQTDGRTDLLWHNPTALCIASPVKNGLLLYCTWYALRSAIKATAKYSWSCWLT